MWFILALGSFLFNGICAFCFKINSMRNGTSDGLLWGFYLTGTLSFITFIWLTHPIQLNQSTLLAGIIMGIALAIGNMMYNKSVQIGPAGLASMVAHSHVVLVVFMSIIYYGEKISWLEIIGILILLIGVILLPFDPNQELRIKNRVWYLFMIICFFLFFVRYGGLKITEEMKLDNTAILFITYLFGFCWFSISLLLKKNVTKSNHSTGVWIGLLAGILSFGAMQTYASALTIGPASIISPITSSHGAIVALLSYWIYKERLSKFQIISFCLLLIGTIFLRI